MRSMLRARHTSPLLALLLIAACAGVRPAPPARVPAPAVPAPLPPASPVEQPGPNQLAYLRIPGQDCLYNVWSALGRMHLEQLLAALRFVRVPE